MARPSRLLADVRSAAQSLGVAAAWAGSRRALRVEEDFIYEMYLLFCVVDDLSGRYAIQYDPGKGKTMHAFPRKPAKKAGRPRFNIKDRITGQVLWQLCAGTKIEDHCGNQHGVDISVQSANSPEDAPNQSHVLIAWECKYKVLDTDRVKKSEFLTFASWIDLLGLKAGAKAKLGLKKLVELEGNAVVSNGRESTVTSNTRQHYQLGEVSNFAPGKAHKLHR